MADYKYTREQISKLAAGLNSNWTCQFADVGGSSAPSASKFNLIPGDFFPATDVDYAKIKWITNEITVGPQVKIKRPIRVEQAQEVVVSYVETDNKDIHKALIEWAEAAKLDSANSKSPKEYSKKLIVWLHDREGNLVMQDTWIVVPTEELRNELDYSFSLDTNVMQLSIIGSE